MKLLRHLLADLQDAPIDLAAFSALTATERFALTSQLDKLSTALSRQERREEALRVEGRPEPEFKVGDVVKGSFIGSAEVVDFMWWNHTQRWAYSLWSPLSEEMLHGSFYDGRKGPAFHMASTIVPVDHIAELENIA